MLEPWLISRWAHASSNLACRISSFSLIHLSCPSKCIHCPWVNDRVAGSPWNWWQRTSKMSTLKHSFLSKMFLPSLYCQKTTTAMDPVLHCLLNVKMTIHLKTTNLDNIIMTCFTSRTGQIGLCWGYIDLFITCWDVVMLTCFQRDQFRVSWCKHSWRINSFFMIQKVISHEDTGNNVWRLYLSCLLVSNLARHD